MDLAALLWTVLAAVLTVAELMTGSFYLLVLAVSAAVAALGAYLGVLPSLAEQLAVAVLLSIVGVLALRLRFRHTPPHLVLEAGGVALVERRNEDGSYRVRYSGTSWDAELVSGAAAREGQPLQVIEFVGNRLKCKPVTE